MCVLCTQRRRPGPMPQHGFQMHLHLLNHRTPIRLADSLAMHIVALRIPGAIRPIETKLRVEHASQDEPRRDTKGPSKMRHRRIAGDGEVAMCQYGRAVAKARAGFVHLSQVHDLGEFSHLSVRQLQRTPCQTSGLKSPSSMRNRAWSTLNCGSRGQRRLATVRSAAASLSLSRNSTSTAQPHRRQRAPSWMLRGNVLPSAQHHKTRMDAHKSLRSS
jgi:hypothetical protein